MEDWDQRWNDAMQSGCCLITSVILHEAILGQILFNVLINNMDDGVSASSWMLSNTGK